ncbi:hypothetical protein QF032_002053 [Streptomyces achromogenes]|nr:hypothetical protein [Streptomyces achromogenes]
MPRPGAPPAPGRLSRWYRGRTRRDTGEGCVDDGQYGCGPASADRASRAATGLCGRGVDDQGRCARPRRRPRRRPPGPSRRGERAAAQHGVPGQAAPAGPGGPSRPCGGRACEPRKRPGGRRADAVTPGGARCTHDAPDLAAHGAHRAHHTRRAPPARRARRPPVRAAASATGGARGCGGRDTGGGRGDREEPGEAVTGLPSSIGCPLPAARCPLPAARCLPPAACCPSPVAPACPRPPPAARLPLPFLPPGGRGPAPRTAGVPGLGRARRRPRPPVPRSAHARPPTENSNLLDKKSFR